VRCPRHAEDAKRSRGGEQRRRHRCGRRRGSATSRSAPLRRSAAALSGRTGRPGTRAAVRQLATFRSNTTPASSRSSRGRRPATLQRLRVPLTKKEEDCYDRWGGNFPTLPWNVGRSKGSVDKLQMGRTTIGVRVPLGAWTCLYTPSALTSPQGQLCRLARSCQTGL
jgi:hypothetical protein